MKNLLILIFVFILFSCAKYNERQTSSGYNLEFTELAQTWDEAMPLGNGMVGNLVWQKNGKLRFSLDRADLWDLRPMKNIDFDKWKFNDVYEHWKSNNYEEVQKAFDVPYNKLAAPSKIPAGALEFNIKALGKVKTVNLDLATATCVVEWEGAKLTTFVDAKKPVGWYKFENLSESVKIALVSPAYNRKSDGKYTDQSRNDLNLLGYPEGKISKGVNFITYNQKGWGDFSYQISTKWNVNRNKLIGCWSVSSANKGWKETPKANKIVTAEFDQISVKTDDGKRKLKMSSSPEVYNNSRKAWFAETTNFDLALIRWTYEKAAELATELGLKKDAAKWKQILSEWPQLAIDPETGFMFAPGFPYNQSHRHFSHQMAYHPLGLVDCSKGEADKKIILNTLRNLEKQGSDWWTGYSFSWLGNLYARAFEGEKAANALHTFAQCFCLKNSFHVNGDQCKAG